VLFILVVVAGGCLLWRLSAGPMPIHFLTPYLEDALATALGGRQIHVQHTILAWDVGAKSLELRARQVTVQQHDNTPLITIPTIDVKLSAWALLRGTMALTAINIEEVSGVLHRTGEGTFHFGVFSAATPPSAQLTPDVAESSTATQQAQVIANLVQNLVAAPEGVSPLATLQVLQVPKGTLVVHDQRLGATWQVTQFDLTLRRHQHGLTGTGHMTLALQDALASVDATLAYARATEKLTLEATFRDLRPSALATVITDAEALAGLDLPVNGSLALTLDGHGRLETLHFTLASAAGSVSYPTVWLEPLAVSDIVIRGHFEDAAGTLSLDEASVTFGMDKPSPPNLRVAGQVQGLGADMTIRGEVALTALPIATLTRLWPVQVGSQARAWVSAQLQAGQVDQALVNVMLALPGGHLSYATLQRLEGTLRAHLTAAHASARFETALAHSGTTEICKLDLSFTDLRPALLATVVPIWQAVAGLDVPFSGTLAAAVDIHGQWRDLRYKLTGGAGSVSHGTVLPHALPISAITAQGHLDGPQATLRLDEATVAFGTALAVGPRLSLSGTAQELKHALTLNGQVTLAGLHMAELQDYWPAGVSADARAWLTENLVAGTVEEATAQVGVTVPITTGATAKLERLRGTLRYQGLEVHYLRPLPAATGVSGSASFNQQGFHIQLTTGQITDMHITGGTVEITGLDRGRDAMAIRVGVDAPLRTVLTLLNHPSLNLLADLGINPATTAGQVTTQLGLALPLRGQILLPKVDITAHGTLTEVSIQQAFFGHTIEHEHFTLDLTKAGLKFTGTAAFATIPLTVVWQEAFSTEAVWKSDVRVTAARLETTHLATLGLDLTECVAGPLAATVTARLDRLGKSTVQATVNLQEAQLTLPWLDWHKPAHAPGEADGTVQFMGSQTPVQGTFRVQAGTLATNGVFQAIQAAEAQLDLELRDLVVGQSHFKAVTITQQRERVDVTLGEGILDAQSLMRALSSQEKAAAPSSASRPDITPNDKTAGPCCASQCPGTGSRLAWRQPLPARCQSHAHAWPRGLENDRPRRPYPRGARATPAHRTAHGSAATATQDCLDRIPRDGPGALCVIGPY
jgi:hypothetical protein